MRILFIAVALLLTQGGTAQQTAQPATISGVVVRQGTDEPLSKAFVELYVVGERPRPYSITTGADGKFNFTDVPPGQYRISVTRLNYVRAEYGDRFSNGCGTPVALAAGQRLTDARIAMTPAGVISGRLYDADREGMPGVSVHAAKYVYEIGRRVFKAVQTVQSNDLGEYRLFGLTPGPFRRDQPRRVQTLCVGRNRKRFLDGSRCPTPA